MGENTSQQPKIYSSPLKKILLCKFTSSAIKSITPSPIKQQFLSNHPIQDLIVGAAVVSLF